MALTSSATAQPVRLGSEFQVNSATSEKQVNAAMAMDADGDFIVSWQSLLVGSFQSRVFARRFSSAGVGQAAEFEVSTYPSIKGLPAAGASAAGNFVITWTSLLQDGSTGLTGVGIFARTFSSSGAALAVEFQVNTYTPRAQSFPAVAVEPDGDFVIVWQSYQSESLYRVSGRRFSSSGTALGGEIQINTYTLSHQPSRSSPQVFPSVAVETNGDFVVVWGSHAQDGSEYGVFARRFSSAGSALAGELQINTYTPGDQALPVVESDADGDFVVVWTSYEQDGVQGGVFARRFSSAGSALAGEFQVNVRTHSFDVAPKVVMSDNGSFVVAWQSYLASNYDIFARRFSATGVALAGEFLVNQHTTNYQLRPTIASEGNGDFVVAWQSDLQDGGDYGIFAQRFAVPKTLDVDGNLELGPLTDGLLLLRYLFGFGGATLTNNAIGPGCSRCDAAAIDTYLDGITIDIDGNGLSQPLTDGLLALRYLFGFRGATLVTGAIGVGCTRCDAAAIEPHLAGLT